MVSKAGLVGGPSRGSAGDAGIGEHNVKLAKVPGQSQEELLAIFGNSDVGTIRERRSADTCQSGIATRSERLEHRGSNEPNGCGIVAYLLGVSWLTPYLSPRPLQLGIILVKTHPMTGNRNVTD
jgi:hypothetical protein